MRVKRWTLVVVCTATSMFSLDIAVVNTALSRIAEDLHTGLGGLQWVVDAYTLALATVVLSAGSLADRLGRRRVFTAGLALFTFGSAACAAAQSIAMLDVARAVQGVGAAAMFAVGLALLAHAFPQPRERVRALGVYGTAIGAAFAVGPLVGGLLTSTLGWQWIFLVNVPIGVAALGLTRAYVQESRDPRAHGIDWPGQATFGAALFLLVLALLRGDEQGWTSAPILAELAGAAIALSAFVAVERRAAHPMLPLRFFRSGAFTGAQLAVFAMAASFFALFFYTTLYLQDVLGLSPIEAGLVYMPGTVLMALVSSVSGRLAARVPGGTLICVALVLAATGMALYTLAGATSSWTAVLPGELLALASVGLFNPALVGVALGSLPPEHSGVAAGASTTFRLGGLAVGVAALGSLIPGHAALGGGDPAAYVHGYHHALLVGAAIAALGAVVAAVLIPGARRPFRAPHAATAVAPRLAPEGA